MNLIFLISIACVLNSDLVLSDLLQDETELIKTPESSAQERQDKLFMNMPSGHLFNRHLPKTIQTSNLAKTFINGMNLGTRIIRQVLKRPKMILVPKLKQQTTYRAIPYSGSGNKHRFQIQHNYPKFYKKPIQMPVKDEIHETHTYSEEHIHVDEDDDDKPEVKGQEESMKHGKEQKNRYLKEIEMREEKKVEAAIDHHSSRFNSEIIHGKPYDFEDDWKPIEKPKPASKLNTFVMDQPISKQVHHHQHIIEIEFENKEQPTYETQPQSSNHNIKAASYSVNNFHKQPSTNKEETVVKEPSLLKTESVDPNYFYSKKIKDADYLQTNPSNKIEIKTTRPNDLVTHVPLVTTTQRPRAPLNYSFRINPMEIPIVSSSTTSSKIESIRPQSFTERRKHKNIVAQTMNRGAKKFNNFEQN